MRPLALLIAPLLLLAAGLVHAQYSWIDEKGIRHLSDRPPPPGTPPENILKAPGRPAAAAAPAADTAHKPDPAEVAHATDKFRHDLKTMTAKSAIAPTPEEKAHLQTCAQASRYKQWLETGAPAFKTEENGKRRPMTQEERVSEAERAKATLAGCPADS
jgi:hypothetical protein